MDLKSAVLSYQFAERAKSELIVCSQLIIALGSFPKAEQAGGRRMLIMVLEATRSELEFARKSTEKSEFRKASDLLSQAISLAESDEYGAAALRVSEAVSASTTVAQESWQVLNEHGIL
ncbi:MAG TPA: hypothetical protein VMS89_05315 [Methanoregulaceae archaeon]|nr:hypothetical protein [Methanoregulaceae archaeon]